MLIPKARAASLGIPPFSSLYLAQQPILSMFSPKLLSRNTGPPHPPCYDFRSLAGSGGTVSQVLEIVDDLFTLEGALHTQTHQSRAHTSNLFPYAAFTLEATCPNHGEPCAQEGAAPLPRNLPQLFKLANPKPVDPALPMLPTERLLCTRSLSPSAF